MFLDLIIEISQDENIIYTTVHTQEKDLYDKFNKCYVYMNTKLRNISYCYLFSSAFIITSFLTFFF